MKSLLTRPQNDAAARQKLPSPVLLSRLPVNPISHVLRLQRKSACPCGGGCPCCQSKLPVQTKLAVSWPGDIYEREADRAAGEMMEMPAPTLQRSCAPCTEGGSTRAKCGAEENLLQRRAEHVSDDGGFVPDDFLYDLGPGQPLDPSTRAFFEPRFGHDFSQVRIHTDSMAAQSAQTVNALAYTVGKDVVFGRGQYVAGTDADSKLLAHELTHVVQQRAGRVALVQRTPARKVSCANSTPLHVPGPAPVDITDPVGVITAAENRANQMFDDVIGEIDFTRQRIIAGEPAAWPTISDALAQGLRLMGLDPDDRAIWTAPSATGERSVPLLLRRLRLIRGTIGAGSFFFFCLGTGMTRLGTCGPAAGGADICTGAVAATCPGEFFTAFCPTFWTNSAEDQAARIIHESAHNFATFIGHTGRFTNAECFARLVQIFAGVPEADQRVDLCPNP